MIIGNLRFFSLLPVKLTLGYTGSPVLLVLELCDALLSENFIVHGKFGALEGLGNLKSFRVMLRSYMYCLY
jgi:hypothetical protein